MNEESIKDLNQETNETELQEIDKSGVAEENQTFQENISIEQFEELKKLLEEKTKEAKKMLLYVVIAIAIALIASALPTLIYNFLGGDFQGNTPQSPPENSPPPTREV